jgi:thiol-disulfide isomerase/thioredoxin
MRVRTGYVIGTVVVLALGAAQAVHRARGAPAVDELVPWEPYETLGQPPYERPVLLEFSADWCLPCRRMQVTTFRDPAFVELLEQWRLRPVRVEQTPETVLEFQDTLRKYHITWLPAMVVIREDGRFSRPITGETRTEDMGFLLTRAFQSLEQQLFWNPPAFADIGMPGRLTVMNFDNVWYLPRETRNDWRDTPTADFAMWCERHVDLVDDGFRQYTEGSEHYRRWGIRTAPTLLVLDDNGSIVARFEGPDAVAQAPAEIARIARELGLDVPDPPRPYSSGSLFDRQARR